MFKLSTQDMEMLNEQLENSEFVSFKDVHFVKDCGSTCYGGCGASCQASCRSTLF